MENGKENKTGYRVEQDSIGEKDIPGDVYYGVQSLRAAENFRITGLNMHPVFELFFSGRFQYFSQCITKINNPYFLPLCWSDYIFVFHTIVADTAFYGQALFFKVNVLPGKTAGFSDSESGIICNLDRQNGGWIFLFKIFDKSFIIFV